MSAQSLIALNFYYREFRSGARMTGAYSLTDFQLALPEYEARDTLNILEALGICIKVWNISIKKKFISLSISPSRSTSLSIWLSQSDRFPACVA